MATAAASSSSSSTWASLSSLPHDPAASGSGKHAASSSTTPGLQPAAAPATVSVAHHRPPRDSQSSSATTNPMVTASKPLYRPPHLRPREAAAEAPPPATISTPTAPASPSAVSPMFNCGAAGTPLCKPLHLTEAAAAAAAPPPLSSSTTPMTNPCTFHKNRASIYSSSLLPPPSLKALITKQHSSGSVNLTPQALHDLQQLFLSFLKEYVQPQEETPYYESLLLGMKKRSSYTVYVTFDQICHFDNCYLLIATCNSLGRLEDWLLPAAQQFLREKGFGNEDEILTKTCLSFSGFPASMEKLEDYILSHGPLVQYVSVSVDKKSILALTESGRSLIEMLVDVLAHKHLDKLSWRGRYSSRDIVIIDYGRGAKQMMILQDTVLQASDDAMVKDLRTAAKLFIPDYRMGNVLPVYFDDLKQMLEEATTECVGRKWFMDSLRYHPALMHSSGRRCFQTMLANINDKYRYEGYTDLDDIMKKIHYAYSDGWKKKVMPKDNDDNDVLYKVYNPMPNEENTDPYNENVAGLIRFIRNFFEHGGKRKRPGEGQCEGQGEGQREGRLADLELFAAKRFEKLLPSLVRTLLIEGLMEKYFGEAWELYRASRSDAADPWLNRSHLGGTVSRAKRARFALNLPASCKFFFI